jgi:class 3 adenylate cyclase
MGDSVDIAFRLEKASKELLEDIVISCDSFKYLGEELFEERYQSATVKGKKEPIRICAPKFRELPQLLLSD